MFGLKNLSIIGPLLLSKALKQDSLQRKRVNEHLARAMGNNKGLWLKLGQMLSIKSEQWKELGELPTGKSVQTIPAQEFDSYIQSLFNEENLDFTTIQKIIYPGVAASLSQVHEAELTSEKTERWIIKAKLPGIHEVVADQLKVFKLAGMSKNSPHGVSPSQLMITPEPLETPFNVNLTTIKKGLISKHYKSSSIIKKMLSYLCCILIFKEKTSSLCKRLKVKLGAK